MPNHCQNKVTITGPDEDIRRFVAAVDTNGEIDGEHFDFNGIIPMPADLKNTSSPVRIQTQEEIDKIWADFNKLDANNQKMFHGRPFDLGITQETNDRLIKEYGHNNWYDWALANWGTKWGAYDSSDWSASADSMSISFTTAWSPPIEFFVNASKLYPTLNFNLIFVEETYSPIGEVNFSNGEHEEVFVTKDPNDEEAKEILEEMGFDLDLINQD